MKTEELIRVVDRELDSLRYNIKAIKDRKTWTEETEGIFLQFRYEEEALQEIRTILSQMPDEEGELNGKSWEPWELCGGESLDVVGFRDYHGFRVYLSGGNGRIPENERFQFCPKCGRPRTQKAWNELGKRLREIS